MPREERGSVSVSPRQVQATLRTRPHDSVPHGLGPRWPGVTRWALEAGRTGPLPRLYCDSLNPFGLRYAGGVAPRWREGWGEGGMTWSQLCVSV